MKKKMLVFVVLGTLLLSCSSPSKEYAKTASELCQCMEESGYEGSDVANTKMNIGVCLLDATVDLKNPEMAEALGEKCPEIKEGFEEFVKSM